MTIAQPLKPPAQDLTITLKRLITLLEADETDDYGILQPNPHAFKTAMALVISAYEIMGDRFPRASASTDETGGVRLTWSKPTSDCQIRLVCPAPPHQQTYLYHELQDEYAVEQNISDLSLVHWLEWMHQA